MSASKYTLTLILIIYLPSSIFSQWIVSNSTLPSGDYHMSIGHYDNNTIIIGGQDNPYRILQFDPFSNTFPSHTDNLSVEIYGAGQYWSQVDNILYMIDPYGKSVHVYDLITNDFDDYHEDITFPRDVDFTGCLAATEEALFIIGGGSVKEGNGPSKSIEILYIKAGIWATGPDMKEERSFFACILHPQNGFIYAVGGWSFGNKDTIEFVNSHSTVKKRWYYTKEKLPVGLANHRLVNYGNYIYTIGGDANRETVDTIYVIDIRDHSVSELPDKMVYGVRAPTPIIIGTRLYAFGGQPVVLQSNATNRYQYIDLPTFDPTAEPTDMPTKEVTAMPTIYPVTPNHNAYDTKMPTVANQPTTGYYDPSTTENGMSDGSSHKSMKHIAFWPVIIGLTLALFIFVIGVFVYIRNRKKEIKSDRDIEMIQKNVGNEEKPDKDGDNKTMHRLNYIVDSSEYQIEVDDDEI